MPAFLRDYGHMLTHEEEKDYIDGRYFSPHARRWMREASRYRAQGGTLSPDDEECSDRVLTAMMVGRKPTTGQETRHRRERLLHYAEGLMPILLEREMQRRGYYYGPDAELPDGVLLPSANELFYKFAAKEFDAPTPGAVKSAYLQRWKQPATDGTH